MTTYPRPTDPVSALSRAHGTTEGHDIDHGRVIGIWENVLHHGADPTGVADSAPYFTEAIAAANATNGNVYVPNGTYKLNSSVALLGLVKLQGAGRRQVNITYKDFNAITATDDVEISHLTFTARSGAAAGSAVKIADAGAYVHDLYVTSTPTNVDPGIYFNGAVGGVVDRCQVEEGANGIKFDGGLSFCNKNLIMRSRVNSTRGATSAAIYVFNGSQVVVRDCTIESNYGYGVQFTTGGNWNVVQDCWFEGNNGHHVYSQGNSGLQVLHNKFHYQSGLPSSARHVMFEGSGTMNRVVGNIFQDSSDSGVYVDIPVGHFYTRVSDNYKLGLASGTTLLDAGVDSYIDGNDGLGSGNGDVIKLPWGGRKFFCNSGSPEGVLTAPVGSLYLQSNGTVTGVVWTKVTGTGNTGWKPLVIANPVTTYAISNATLDRTYNANASSVDELSDVLASLIYDLSLQGLTQVNFS